MPPGPGYSGNSTHDANIATAVLTLQTANAGVTAQSTLNANAIAFHRAIAKSAIANGVSPSVSMQALRFLGQTGV